MPFSPWQPSALLLFWKGSPSRINYRKVGTLILTSLLKDLDEVPAKLCLLARSHRGDYAQNQGCAFFGKPNRLASGVGGPNTINMPNSWQAGVKKDELTMLKVLYLRIPSFRF